MDSPGDNLHPNSSSVNSSVPNSKIMLHAQLVLKGLIQWRDDSLNEDSSDYSMVHKHTSSYNGNGVNDDDNGGDLNVHNDQNVANFTLCSILEVVAEAIGKQEFSDLLFKSRTVRLIFYSRTHP